MSFGSKLKRTVKSNKFFKILTVILIAILFAGLIGLGISFNKTITTDTLSPTEFSRGAINSSGSQVESDESLISNYVTIDGLKIEIKDNADISYKVFYYKADKTYLSSSESKTADFVYANGTAVENAEFVRIQITPNADSSISLLEVYTYANQLTVTFNK